MGRLKNLNTYISTEFIPILPILTKFFHDKSLLFFFPTLRFCNGLKIKPQEKEIGLLGVIIPPNIKLKKGEGSRYNVFLRIRKRVFWRNWKILTIKAKYIRVSCFEHIIWLPKYFSKSPYIKYNDSNLNSPKSNSIAIS